MNFSFGRIFGIGKSLKKQVLFFTIVPMVIGISFFAYFTISSIVAEGESRVKAYKEELIARKKEELKSYVDIAFKTIQGLKPDQAISTLKHMTYGENGYFWINDTGLPYPKMIMHPTIPSLDGQVMDDPKYNCALGKKENLFKAFVEVSKENGEGFVDYLWPKPTTQGLTQDLPKLSYVRLYKPQGWIIGTGVYVDDIDALMVKEKDRVGQEVRTVIDEGCLSVPWLSSSSIFSSSISLSTNILAGPSGS